jgi:hypothetical protein
MVYSSLTVGQHTFSVRATDAAGNVDETPATYSWTVEQPSELNEPLQPGGSGGGQEPGSASGGTTGSQEPGNAGGSQEPGHAGGGQEPGHAGGSQEPGNTSGGQEPGGATGGQGPSETPNVGQQPAQSFLFLPQINS